jgi:hypothetical protein
MVINDLSQIITAFVVVLVGGIALMIGLIAIFRMTRKK